MKISYWFGSLFLFLAGLAAAPARATAAPPTALFEENKAQWDAAVRYRALVPGGAVWLRATGFTYDWVRAADLRRQAAAQPASARSGLGAPHPTPALAPVLHAHAVAVDFLGATPAAPLPATAPAEAYTNYFVGTEARHWATKVRSYAAVTYPQLYPGIDVRVHSSPTGQFEYDVMVAPGADPAAVRLRYRGASTLRVRSDGVLVIGTSVGEVREQRPVAWQLRANGQRQPVACRFRLTGAVLRFELPAGYDPTRALVLDPVVQASTYTGRTALPVGTAYDAAGNMYVGGRDTGYGFFFPATPGAYVVPQALGICVSKFNATGTQLLYSTTLGGTGPGNDCALYRLKTDAAGNLVLAALARERTNFPMLPTSYDATWQYGKVILAKLDPTGTALLATTYLGGTNTARLGQDLNDFTTDASGAVYVVGDTYDPTFPTTPGAYRRTYAAGPNGEGFIAHFDPALSTLRWSTLMASPLSTGLALLTNYVLAVRVNAAGQVYFLAGVGPGFPVPAAAASSDYSSCIIGCLSATGAQVVYATYLPSTPLPVTNPRMVALYDLALDAAGNVVVCGLALSATVQPTPGAYFFNAPADPNLPVFVARLDPTLRTVRTMAVLATGSRFRAGSVAVDACGNLLFLFQMQSANGTGTQRTNAPPATPLPGGSSQPANGGFYLGALTADGSQLLFNTFYGSSSSVFLGYYPSASMDAQGRFYLAYGPNWVLPPPYVLPGSYRTTPQNPGVNADLGELVATILDPQLVTRPAPLARFTVAPTPVCPGQPVQLTNTSTNAGPFRWDFGDGSPADSLTPNPRHGYATVGTYRVRLQVRALPGACTRPDTTSLLVQVQPLPARVLPRRVSACAGEAVLLDAGPAGSTYAWSTGATTQTIRVTAPGPYVVQVGSGTCARTDTVTVLPLPAPVRVLAQQATLCPSTALVLDAGNPGSTYNWSTGAATQTIAVTTAGRYFVAIRNPCGRTDTVYVGVAPAPTLQRDSVNCGPATLRVVGAAPGSTFRWSTGATTDRIAVDQPGRYTVAVSGPMCQFQLQGDAAPTYGRLLVPNIFTPNAEDALNPTFTVPNLPPSTRLRVFSRWGKLVYQAADYRNDWAAAGLPDGVYYYLLENPQFCQGSQVKGWVEVRR